MRIALLPIGDVDQGILAHLSAELRLLGDVEILDWVNVPESAYDESRGQYVASRLKELTASYSHDRILGVTGVDIYERPLRFVFGLADIRGKSAVISTGRLVDSDSTTKERASKEALHELGHTFGLRHCQNKECVMTFSNCLDDTDNKEKSYCHFCTLKLRKAGVLP